MKVNFNLKNNFVTQPSFAGFQRKKTEEGDNVYKFNLPYDDANYDAYLEVYKVQKGSKGEDFVATKPIQNFYDDGSKKLSKSGTEINMSLEYDLLGNEPFAYRYKLVNKNDPKDTQYVTESGLLIDYKGKDNSLNLVTPSGSPITKGGAMLLAIPDSYNVGWIYDEKGEVKEDKNAKAKAEAASKTFSNKLGGTLAGLENKIDDIKKTGYSRVLLTPIFTDDSLSSHGYWIKNPYQMVQSAGNINNYETLVGKMFKSGINLVADGAFVNEGLEGLHFKDVLKNGKDSPYYEWFRFSGIESGPLSMGVFSKNQKFIAHKVVNSPYIYKQASDGTIKQEVNTLYERTKPTYVQIYDKRLVSPEQAKDTTKRIKAYDKLNANHLYEINTHDDTVIPYSFEIKPETYTKNINDLNKMNEQRKHDKKEQIPLGSPLAARILTKSDSFQLEDKFEGKFETWDANTDIAKLNYMASNADVKSLKNLPIAERNKRLEKLRQRNIEAQDFAISAAKYWTRKTEDAILITGAQEIGKIDNNPDKIFKKISDLVDENELPKSLKHDITPTMIENALNDIYPLKRAHKTSDRNDLLLSGMMDLPLESIEFGDDVSAVLGYPQISKRASKPSEIGVSKYLLDKDSKTEVRPEYKDVYAKMQGIYQVDLEKIGNEIITDINKQLGSSNKLFVDKNATKFGRYVLPIIAQDIAKFAIIKSLYPEAEVNTKDGVISYDYKDLKNYSLKDIGIKTSDPEKQAEELVSHIKLGLKEISNKDKSKIADALFDKIKNTNATSFMVSELIADRTQSGLDWRIDATKDIADTDSLKNGHSSFEDYWSSMTKFWEKFTSAVKDENQNSYFTAEITDVWDLANEASTVGTSGRYANDVDAINKFLSDTGIQTTPNYSYLFTDLLKSISKTFDTGKSLEPKDRNAQIHNILVADRAYLNSANLDSLLYSYTFAGNHDKPRALHCLALDMELFHGDFSNDEQRKTAVKVLKKPINMDYDLVSAKAVAMGDVARDAFEQAIDKSLHGDKNEKVKNAIFAAISDLAQGLYTEIENGKRVDKSFSPDSFGVKPFDKTIDAILTQAERNHDLNLSDDDKKEIFNNTFEIMLKPAMSKMEVLMEYLVLLPGNPTLFAGDDLGLTGYDEKSKNVYLQNRSFLNWDMLKDENKKFLKKYNENINSIMGLRSSKKLAPLNSGTPYALKLQPVINRPDTKISGLLRQNADGAMVLSLLNTSGTNLDSKLPIGELDSHVKLDKISLGSSRNHGDKGQDGIITGLAVGTEFKNYDARDKSVYKVVKEGNESVIKRYNTDGSTGDIDIYHPTLILYADAPKVEKTSSNPSFTARKVMYNPQYNFVSNPYKQIETPKLGQQLLLV